MMASDVRVVTVTVIMDKATVIILVREKTFTWKLQLLSPWILARYNVQGFKKNFSNIVNFSK
jgi:hypothetical protein